MFIEVETFGLKKSNCVDYGARVFRTFPLEHVIVSELSQGYACIRAIGENIEYVTTDSYETVVNKMEAIRDGDIIE